MLRFVFLISIVIFAVAIGCGGAGSVQQNAVPESRDTSKLVEIPHPEYEHWSKFEIGSYTIRQKKVAGKDGNTIVTTTVKLADKDEKQVVVETQITVKRGDDPELINPSFTAEFPAVFPLPDGMSVEQFSKPSLKAELVGEEAIEIQGKPYQCTKYNWTEVNEAGPMLVTVWRSNDVPGRTVKEVSSTTDVGESSSEEVLKIVIPESKLETK